MGRKGKSIPRSILAGINYMLSYATLATFLIPMINHPKEQLNGGRIYLDPGFEKTWTISVEPQ